MQLRVSAADGRNCDILFQPGDSLAEAVYLSGEFAPPPLCSGLGRCGLCRVRFLSAPPAATPEDELILGIEAAGRGWRLGCRHKAASGMHIFIPDNGRKENIIAPTNAAPGAPPKSLLLAVDLGTTSLVWAALAPVPGVPGRFQAVREGRELNPQIGAGSDVLSRISAALAPEGGARMQELTLAALRRIVAGLPAPVSEICLAGNTAMTALTRGGNVTGLAAAPYHLDFKGNRKEKLPDLPPLYFPPQVSAFIGADISAGMAALLAEKPDFPFLLADLGTNGEFVLALSPERALAVSVPMGPALEGIGLTYGALAGVGGADGVITAFNLTPQGLQPVTAENSPQKPGIKDTYAGISGTGYLSLTHILLKLGLISENGNFTDPKAQPPLAQKLALGLRMDNGQARFELPGGLSLHARDLEEIIKVKAAFSAAVHSLLKAARLAPAALQKCYLAGALGTYVNADDLTGLGFLPARLKTDKITAAGNLALAGAKLMLTTLSAKDAAAAWAKSVEVLNLTEDKNFMDLYLEHMRFCFPGMDYA